MLRHSGPLADDRGPAGRARAIRAAVRTTSDPVDLEGAIAAAVSAGYTQLGRQLLFAI